MKQFLKAAFVAARESIGDSMPRALSFRMPPLRGAVFSVREARLDERTARDAAVEINYWEEKKPRERPLPKFAYPHSWAEFDRQTDVDVEPLFVATCRNARVFGRFPTVVVNHNRLFEECSRVHSESIDRHPAYSMAMLAPPKRLRGRTLMLANAFGGSFYHWLTDNLPRLHLLKRAGVDVRAFDHVLLPEPTGPFLYESLEHFPELRGERHILSNADHFLCDSLVCPSLTHAVGGAESASIEYVRLRIDGGERASKGTRRIYISRGKAGRRKLHSEDELLRRVVLPAGFEAYHLEDLTLRSQCDLFRDAAVVVAPHGAGLTNMIFAPRNCIAIEMLSMDYNALCYWHLADEIGLDYRYVVGRSLPSPGGGSRQFNDFSIAAEDLSSAIAGLP